MATYYIMNKEQLHEMFEYKDGNLVWKVSKQGLYIGDIAGGKDGKGYITIGINYKIYKAHRLIWIYHNGDIEDGLFIDHIDRNPLNNRIENLRLATPSQNKSNVTKRKDNKSGYKGVCWNKRGKKWEAKITHNNKCKHLGYFVTAELAHIAYVAAATKYQGDFAFTK